MKLICAQSLAGDSGLAFTGKLIYQGWLPSISSFDAFAIHLLGVFKGSRLLVGS